MEIYIKIFVCGSVWFGFEKSIQNLIQSKRFSQNVIQTHPIIFDFMRFRFFGSICGFNLDRFRFEHPYMMVFGGWGVCVGMIIKRFVFEKYPMSLMLVLI